jgi:phosphatidylglycerophosphate synthase
MTTEGRSLQHELAQWNAGHAIGLVPAAAAASLGAPAWLPCAVAAASFAVLLARFRGRWTPAGRLGPANMVTLARLAGMFALPFVPPQVVAGLGLLLLALDGVDGWVARRTATNGEFGAFLDQECDAFLLLLLCLLLHRLPGGLGPWILVPGLLRYLFVLYVRVARPPLRKEPRSRRAAWVFVLAVLSLLLCFAAYPDRLDVPRALAAATSLAIVLSFAASLYRMHSARTGA